LSSVQPVKSIFACITLRYLVSSILLERPFTWPVYLSVHVSHIVLALSEHLPLCSPKKTSLNFRRGLPNSPPPVVVDIFFEYNIQQLSKYYFLCADEGLCTVQWRSANSWWFLSVTAPLSGQRRKRRAHCVSVSERSAKKLTTILCCLGLWFERDYDGQNAVLVGSRLGFDTQSISTVTTYHGILASEFW